MSLPHSSACRRRCVLQVALLLLAVVFVTPAMSATPLMAGTFEPPRAAPEFMLQGSDGQVLSLARFRGKVVLLQFGFTSCPNVCPTTLATLAQVRRDLGGQAADVQVLFITVDPERDDVERLRRYVTTFDPGFIGGTGTEEELAAVRETYGVAAQRTGTNGSPQYGHSSFVTLIDRKGLLRAIMPFGYKAETYVHDLRALLTE